ncbi:unnamed protein product, partial [Coregonus sp. 'balchen']
MAQHDFVPAWLNFSTPQPAKVGEAKAQRGAGSHAAFERHGEHLARGDALPGGGLGRGLPTWHTGTWGQERPQHGRHPKRPVGERERPGALRQCNGTFHPRRGPLPSNEGGQKDKLKFVEEGFPSLNPESSGKPVAQSRAVGTPVGVWEHPPGAKQTMTKMLVIKKVSKEDPGAAFSAGFANTRPHLTNSTKTPVSGPSVYKNLMTKPATAPTKTGPWKPNGRETKTSFNFSGQDSAFTNPAASVTKPLITSVRPPAHVSPKEPPSSITPPRLKHRSTDRKSEFLQGLKDERNGDGPTSTSPSATPEPQENGGEVPENGISHSLSNTDTDHLSSTLEAEHRLLKAMGWQEYPENDVNFLPLTDEELKEFQDKTEKLKRNRLGQNGVLLKPFLKGLPLLLSWRNPLEPELEEVTETESTSSSQTSDDDADA